jgi:hypothetical protein
MRSHKGRRLVMARRQSPPRSPQAVIATELSNPLTKIHVVQVRVGIRPEVSYPSRSKTVSHRTFSETRGYREDRGGNSFETSHDSKEVPDTGFQGLGIADIPMGKDGVLAQGHHAVTIDKEA